MDPEQFDQLIEEILDRDETVELTDAVAEVPQEQLSGLRDQIVAAADALREGLETSENPAGDADALEALADMFETVQGRIDEVEAATAAERERAAAAAARFGSDEDQPETIDDEGAEAADDSDEGEDVETLADDSDEDDQPEAEADSDDVPAVEDEPEETALAASGNRRRQARARLSDIRRNRPATHEPQPEPVGGPNWSLTAGGSLQSQSEGSEFESMHALANAFTEMNRKVGRIRRVNGEQRFHVARLNFERPISLGDSPMENFRAISDLQKSLERGEQDALTASGGFCAPAEVSYDFFDISSDDGLLSLPTANATRGQVSIPVSPSLDSIFSDEDWEAAVSSEWDSDRDAAAVDSEGVTQDTKPCFRVECPSFGDFEVIARPLCLTFGNFTSQFYPELVADVLGKSLRAHSHGQNADIIGDVVALADAVSYSGSGGGAIVGLLRYVSFHAAQYREKYRMNRSAPLEVVLPHWVRSALVVDHITRSSTTEYGVADSAVDAWFAARNLNPQFVYDWQGISTAPDSEYPASANVLLYAPGTVVQLDAPAIDLGMVRDSTLNSTNDWQQFVETFAGVAKIGHEVRLLQDVPVCPSGGVGAEESITCAGS